MKKTAFHLHSETCLASNTKPKIFGLIESCNKRNLFDRFLAGLHQSKAVSHSSFPLCALAPPTTTERYSRGL